MLNLNRLVNGKIGKSVAARIGTPSAPTGLFEALTKWSPETKSPEELFGRSIGLDSSYLSTLMSVGEADDTGEVAADDVLTKYIADFMGRDATATVTEAGAASIRFEAYLIDKASELLPLFVETTLDDSLQKFYAVFLGNVTDAQLAALQEGLKNVCRLAFKIRTDDVNAKGHVAEFTVVEGTPAKSGSASRAAAKPADSSRSDSPRPAALPATERQYRDVVESEGIPTFLMPAMDSVDGLSPPSVQFDSASAWMDRNGVTWVRLGDNWKPSADSITPALAIVEAKRRGDPSGSDTDASEGASGSDAPSGPFGSPKRIGGVTIYGSDPLDRRVADAGRLLASRRRLTKSESPVDEDDGRDPEEVRIWWKGCDPKAVGRVLRQNHRVMQGFGKATTSGYDYATGKTHAKKIVKALKATSPVADAGIGHTPPPVFEGDDSKTPAADRILSQLGGQKFTAMAGSSMYVGGNDFLTFKIGRNPKGVTKVKIVLDKDDTYTVKFFKIRGTDVKTVGEKSGVYADSLRQAIEDGTGLRVSLGTLRESGITESRRKAADGWRATRGGRKLHFNASGELDKGNPYVVASMGTMVAGDIPEHLRDKPVESLTLDEQRDLALHIARTNSLDEIDGKMKAAAEVAGQTMRSSNRKTSKRHSLASIFQFAKSMKGGRKSKGTDRVMESLSVQTYTAEEIVVEAKRLDESRRIEPGQAGQSLRSGYDKWLKSGDVFIPTSGQTEPTIERYAYYLEEQMGGPPVFRRFTPRTDALYRFEGSVMEKVLDEADKFWSSAEDYAKFDLMHSRGIILHGPPGTGKTSILHQVADMIVERDDVVLYTRSIRLLNEALLALKAIEPNRKVAVVIEDADNCIRYEEQSMLNLLDGEHRIDGVLYLASTNYLDRFPPRLLRPGRFDSHIMVEAPPKEGRLAYLKAKLTKKTDESEDAIDALAEQTEGMTFADLRELVIGHYVLKQPLESVIRKLRGNPAPVEPKRAPSLVKESVDEGRGGEGQYSVHQLVKAGFDSKPARYVGDKVAFRKNKGENKGKLAWFRVEFDGRYVAVAWPEGKEVESFAFFAESTNAHPVGKRGQAAREAKAKPYRELLKRLPEGGKVEQSKARSSLQNAILAYTAGMTSNGKPINADMLYARFEGLKKVADRARQLFDVNESAGMSREDADAEIKRLRAEGKDVKVRRNDDGTSDVVVIENIDEDAEIVRRYGDIEFSAEALAELSDLVSLVEDDSTTVNKPAADMLVKELVGTKPYVAMVYRPIALYKARGEYRAADAPKLAKKIIQFGGRKMHKAAKAPGEWHAVFNPATREYAQKELVKRAEGDVAKKKYDQVLPKKYQKGFKGYDKSEKTDETEKPKYVYRKAATIKEANAILAKESKGHGIVKTESGDRISSCRCSPEITGRTHVVVVVPDSERDADPYPSVSEGKETVASVAKMLLGRHDKATALKVAKRKLLDMKASPGIYAGAIEAHGGIDKAVAFNKKVIDAIKSAKVDEAAKPGVKVDKWYNREKKSWVVQCKDSAGNQIGDADYVGTEGEADNLVAEYKGKAKAVRKRVAEADDTETEPDTDVAPADDSDSPVVYVRYGRDLPSQSAAGLLKLAKSEDAEATSRKMGQGFGITVRFDDAKAATAFANKVRTAYGRKVKVRLEPTDAFSVNEDEDDVPDLSVYPSVRPDGSTMYIVRDKELFKFGGGYMYKTKAEAEKEAAALAKQRAAKKGSEAASAATIAAVPKRLIDGNKVSGLDILAALDKAGAKTGKSTRVYLRSGVEVGYDIDRETVVLEPKPVHKTLASTVRAAIEDGLITPAVKTHPKYVEKFGRGAELFTPGANARAKLGESAAT